MTLTPADREELRALLAKHGAGLAQRILNARDLGDNTGYGWDQRWALENAVKLVRAVPALLDQLDAQDERVAVPDGWVLVPRETTEEWANSLANLRQGERDTPRCEPPSEYDIRWCRNLIRQVLAAAPQPTEWMHMREVNEPHPVARFDAQGISEPADDAAK